MGRHCTWLDWAGFRTAQLSGCLSQSSYAEWQSTSGLAMYKYYTCLAVPGYYAFHHEVAVPPQESCSSCEATWKGRILQFSALKQITVFVYQNRLGCKPLWSFSIGSPEISGSSIFWEEKQQLFQPPLASNTLSLLLNLLELCIIFFFYIVKGS